MNITDLITELFRKTDDALTDATHHSQSILSISELGSGDISLLRVIPGK